MFLELVATFVAGIAGAGLMLLVNRITGGRLPRWLTPVAAGAAMLVATISSEYGWFSRTAEVLPPEFEIVQTVESKALYRPWTYLRPFVDRFAAVDMASLSRNDNAPDLRLGDVYYFGRWAPVNKVAVLVDCKAARRAALMDAVSFTDDGQVQGASWVQTEADDPILKAMCREDG